MVTGSPHNRGASGCGGRRDWHRGRARARALTNLQQLCDSIMSLCAIISEECVQHKGSSEGSVVGPSTVYLKSQLDMGTN